MREKKEIDLFFLFKYVRDHFPLVRPIKNIFLSLSTRSLIDLKAKIIGYNKLKIGKNCVVRNCLIDTNSKKKNISFEVGDNTKISDYSYLYCHGGYIKIGKNCSIGHFCYFTGSGGIEIGDYVLIAHRVNIIAFSHIYKDANKRIEEQRRIEKGIKIGNDVWIGTNVTILDGVTIGDGCVIGSGAVVNKNIPPYSVAVGVPAKVIKKRK